MLAFLTIIAVFSVAMFAAIGLIYVLCNTKTVVIESEQRKLARIRYTRMCQRKAERMRKEFREARKMKEHQARMNLEQYKKQYPEAFQ